MSTLDCNGIHRNGLAGIGLPSIDNTARLNTSRTCDCWTHSKNSDTSSEPLLYKPLYTRNSLSTTPIQQLRCSLSLADPVSLHSANSII